MSEEVFRWVISGAVAISTICIVAMAMVAVGLSRTISKLKVRVEGMADHFEPILQSVRDLTVGTAPKISQIATHAVDVAANAKDISDVAVDQAHRFAEVGRDIADRTRAQVARVDSVVDETVEQVHVAGDNVREAVLKPVREASAVMAGIKAGISTFTGGRRPTMDNITQDEEMFI